MKSILITAAAFCLTVMTAHTAAANSAPTVTNVTVVPRDDGSGVVDIYYTLTDADWDACKVWLKASDDGGATWDVPINSVSGFVGERVSPGINMLVTWDAGVDVPDADGCNYKVRVYADDGNSGLAPMCRVPAGQFKTSTDVWVSMDAYYIDKYEVTNELYCQFLNAGGNDDHWHTSTDIEQISAGNYRVKDGLAQRPVRYANWFDAKAFCDWRSEEEGLPAGTYNLPTEAQWEKAAGWDPSANKLWTYATKSDSISCRTVNYNRCVGHTTDVGSYPYPSYYGCYDMCGNVWEWCQDWYQSTYPSSTSNPTGPTTGTYPLLRGGAWLRNEIDCRVSYRYNYSPMNWYGGSGFRCARTLQ